MLRYLAFAWWDDTAQQETSAIVARLLSKSAVWQLALRIPGLIVCYARITASSDGVRTIGATGVILGTLFKRSGIAGQCSLNEIDSNLIASTAGRQLIEGYWGRYVAFLSDPQSSSIRVLRDPSSGLPCLTTNRCGVQVYWSSMADAVEIGLGPFHIDWQYIAASLCSTVLRSSHTGLRDVSQILGAECVSFRDSAVEHTFYWHPDEVATSECAGGDIRHATDRLHEATLTAVKAWAACYSNVLVELSGGIDSSIVFACLADEPRGAGLTGLNHHSPGADTDEREYARLVARHFNCPLIERKRDSLLSLEQLSSVPQTPTPLRYLHWIETGGARARIAAEANAGAIFSGFGGDQLFYVGEARWGAVDYVRAHGIRGTLAQIAMNAARMDRVSLWSVLSDALVYGLLRKRHNFLAGDAGPRTLIPPDVQQAARAHPEFTHPWIQLHGNSPPGKAWHILQIVHPWEGHLSIGDGEPDYIAPLYSQPVMEACLPIATWKMTVGGIDRALARTAFETQLPKRTVRRRAKGGLEEHVKSITKHNLPFIRQMLLDGVLVRENILDRRLLDRALSSDQTGFEIGTVEIFRYLDAEAWARAW